MLYYHVHDSDELSVRHVLSAVSEFEFELQIEKRDAGFGLEQPTHVMVSNGNSGFDAVTKVSKKKKKEHIFGVYLFFSFDLGRESRTTFFFSKYTAIAGVIPITLYISRYTTLQSVRNKGKNASKTITAAVYGATLPVLLIVRAIKSSARQ